MSNPALIVIDLQNDYFPGGLFPLHSTSETLTAVLKAIANAKKAGVPVIHIQHIADPQAGIAPFFNKGTEGANIHTDVMAAAPDAPVVIKHFADSFERTNLQETLQNLEVDELIICGMMTQNCVTFTALSRKTDDYNKVTVLTDASATVSEILHLIALNALSTRVNLAALEDILP